MIKQFNCRAEIPVLCWSREIINLFVYFAKIIYLQKDSCIGYHNFASLFCNNGNRRALRVKSYGLVVLLMNSNYNKSKPIWT